MFKRMRPVIWLWLAALLLVACGASAELSQSEVAPDFAFEEGASAPPAEPMAPGDSGALPPSIDRSVRDGTTERLIIKTGNMSLEVDDVETAMTRSIDVVVGLGGYVVSQEMSGMSRSRSATVTFGVPADQFENALTRLRELGEVSSESLSGEDVTEEFVDLNSRLENLQLTRERVRGFLDEAANVEEALAVDRELRQIEEEINVVSGRINYLADRAAFSTITLRMSQFIPAPVPTPETWQIGETARRAVVELQDTTRNVTDGLVYFGIVCGPWLLVLGLLAWGAIAIVRRVRRGRQPAAGRARQTPPAPPSDTPTA